MNVKKIARAIINYLHFLSWSLWGYVLFCACYNGFNGINNFETTVRFNHFGEVYLEMFIIPFLIGFSFLIFLLEAIKKKK